MNLEELRIVQQQEKEYETLQELGDSFYTEARSLAKENESASKILKKIYEKRMGKVVRLASLSASGSNIKPSEMTKEEREIYRKIVDELEASRKEILEGKETPSTDKIEEKIKKENDLGEKNHEKRDKNGQNVQNYNYIEVKVFQDLPSFLGIDGKEYKISKGETAEIPEKNAKALCQKDVAVKINRID